MPTTSSTHQLRRICCQALIPRKVMTIGLLLAVTLTACGNDETANTDPTAAATLTPVSIVSGDPPRSSPIPGSPVATPGSGEPATVGDLATLVGEAWGSVTAYRATSTNGDSGGVITGELASPPVGSPVAAIASPVPDDGGLLADDEVVMPGQRHQIVREAGAESEFVATGGMVYTRGAFNRVYIDPSLDPATWVALDPATVPVTSPLAVFVDRFAGQEPFTSPFANLQPQTLGLPLAPRDTSQNDGRTCRSYRVVQTTQTGERVDITLAIDEQNLPCFVETAAGGIVNRTTYDDFNARIIIEAPDDVITLDEARGAASPVASPVVPPSTP